MINAISLLLTPLSYMTTRANDLLLLALGVEGNAGERISSSELRMMVSGASQSGAVEGYEQDMIEGVLDLQRTQVQQIMTPRVEIVAVDGSAPLSELLQVTTATKYSRVPVYNSTVDEILGIVRTNDLLGRGRATDAALMATNVSTIMEATAFIPESMSIMNALKQMRRQRLHIMVVVDEFGGTSGIVTLEDILETLVGEIYDEDDEEELVEDDTSIVRNADGSYIIDGMADLDDVCETLDVDVPAETLEQFSTLSGFLCHQAGEIPEEGDVILADGLRFDVLEADERRLLSLRATNLTNAAVGGVEGGGA